MDIINEIAVLDECRHGRFFTLKSDNSVGLSMRIYGEWAEAEVHLFSQVVSGGDVALEAGANIGSHTVPLSRLVGPEGCIHAFEPLGLNHRLLCSNLLINNCNNAKTYQCTVGAQAGFVRFPDPDPTVQSNFGAIGLFQSTPRSSVCPEITVDALELSRLDFLKVDVEGYEREVIKGAGETIARCRPTLFVETLNHYSATLAPDGHTQWLIETLKPLGYSFWHYITPIFYEANARDNRDNAFPGQWSFDMLCMPNERGSVRGLPNAENEPMFCDDPQQWQRVELVA